MEFANNQCEQCGRDYAVCRCIYEIADELSVEVNKNKRLEKAIETLTTEWRKDIATIAELKLKLKAKS